MGRRKRASVGWPIRDSRLRRRGAALVGGGKPDPLWLEFWRQYGRAAGVSVRSQSRPRARPAPVRRRSGCNHPAAREWGQRLLGTASNSGALHRPGAANDPLHRGVQRRLGRNLRVSRCRRDGPIVVLVWHSEQDLAATVCLVAAVSGWPLCVAGALLGAVLTSLFLQQGYVSLLGATQG